MNTVTREHKAGLELALDIVAGHIVQDDAANELRKLIAQASAAPVNTTSDQYRAELYDEMFDKARSLGFGNIIDALTELERMKASAAPEQDPVAWGFPDPNPGEGGRPFLLLVHTPSAVAKPDELVPLYTHADLPAAQDVSELMRQHRIAVTPEHEGQWHADLYGDDPEPLARAEADTPEAAVHAVIAAHRAQQRGQ